MAMGTRGPTGTQAPGAATRPIIEVRDLVKVYSSGNVRVDALRGVSLEVPRGEMVGVMGPSGPLVREQQRCLPGWADSRALRIRGVRSDSGRARRGRRLSYPLADGLPG